ncbi:nucleotide exchange factor GrpE [Desulfobacterales bacterium HSG16]|nr:nucleotide exchange factor GrpE [Desulfobacterales bacterium HSG16]
MNANKKNHTSVKESVVEEPCEDKAQSKIGDDDVSANEHNQVETEQDLTEDVDVSEPDIEPDTTQEENEETDEDLAVNLEKSEKEVVKAQDHLMRVSAEFENYKKRSLRDFEGFKKFANESLIKDLLPVVDNLQRALESSESNESPDNGIIEGVSLTLKEILKLLEKYSVRQIEAVGTAFDPNLHEAAMQEEVEDKPHNTVLKEFQKGYTMHDRLLRPAMVVVSKAKSNGNESEKNGKK